MNKWRIYSAVFIGGAAVLAIEILGTRILGPFYGVSLFLWSALITVTLVALSVGYAIGGRWADKGATVLRLYSLLAGAGIWTLLIPWLRTPILFIAEPFGLRFAVLVAAFILFVPPLTLLGMVSPYAIRVQAESLHVVGRTAGDLYAISTVGSVVAALLTGFVLIPNVGVSRLTLLIGGILLVTSIVGLALELTSRGKQVAAVTATLLGVCGLWRLSSVGNSHEPGVITIEQSPYAEIRVLDSPETKTRMLLIDGGTHTIVNPASWESYFPYVAVMGLTRCIAEKPGKMLLVGVGGGSVIKDFTADGWRVDAVEIDPVVVKVAHAHFGLEPSEARMFAMDGRQFLIAENGKYDIVAMDAFGSSSIPFHLVTEEAFGLAASRLNPGGIVALNLESKGWDGPVVRAIAATLKQHFKEVLALPTEASRDELGNVVIFASNAALRVRPDLDGKGRVDCEALYRNQHANRGWNNRFAPDTRAAPILTDDLNPVDVWSEETNVVARQDLHHYFSEHGLSSY
ncbi:MAG: fused MFS/spermidine synthase [Nitrospira sp.]|nr:fused MFS/spermidine synthase [Nitrospira sp.]MDH5194680.1 fused MFS/spermidine synthase [Nitrospira sp.]